MVPLFIFYFLCSIYLVGEKKSKIKEKSGNKIPFFSMSRSVCAFAVFLYVGLCESFLYELLICIWLTGYSY